MLALLAQLESVVRNPRANAERAAEALAGLCGKTRLFGAERDGFQPGAALRIVRLAGVAVAPLICFDAEFPEPVRALAAGGAELLVTASANMGPFAAEHEVATRARA